MDSPNRVARLEGVLYLVIIVLGIFGEVFVRDRILVAGDAAATVANLRSMEMLWRCGIAAELVLLLCTIVSELLLFMLLRPVGKDLALLGSFFGLVGVAVETAYALQLVQTLFPIGSATYLQAFSPAQLAAMASLTMKAHANGFGIALLMFGAAFLVRGHLIAMSGYFPKAIGVLYQIAGIAYLVNTFGLVLAPQYASRLFVLIVAPAFIGEASFCIWLLVKGVKLEQWRRWEPA